MSVSYGTATTTWIVTAAETEEVNMSLLAGRLKNLSGFSLSSATAATQNTSAGPSTGTGPFYLSIL